ncbi:MAG: geranylgeranylglycerol-phosphate geranylgeranyltransferase [Candidatus Bathyarchaeota archaeon]|nr:geranylgeranylglycerol-phosphate geranylgeranyltransferase [Candidatus Bathyarchaeota archaeon]
MKVVLVGKANAFVRLIRPVNCLMMGFAVIVGAALADRGIFVQQLQNLLLGFSTGFFLTGATMAVNDYYDREIDAINEPKRPIPSGAIAPKEALAFAFTLTVVGFLAAMTTNLECLVLAAASWAVFVLYTTKGKRTGFLGNLMVSICIAVPFVYGGFVVEGGLTPIAGIFVAIVFLSNTGREVTKGIVDLEGDREKNIRTVAVLHGEKKAAVVAAALHIFAVSLTPVPWFLGMVFFWYIPFVVLTDMGLILASSSLLLNPSGENAKRIKNRGLVWFLSGLLAFITGVIG